MTGSYNTALRDALAMRPYVVREQNRTAGDRYLGDGDSPNRAMEAAKWYVVAAGWLKPGQSLPVNIFHHDEVTEARVLTAEEIPRNPDGTPDEEFLPPHIRKPSDDIRTALDSQEAAPGLPPRRDPPSAP